MQSETHEVVSIVQESVTRTDHGVTTVAETRTAFERIGSVILDITQRIEQMAAESQMISEHASR